MLPSFSNCSIGVLKPAPSADIIDQNGLEISLVGSDLGHQVLQRLAAIEPQAGTPRIFENTQNAQATSLGIAADDIELVFS